MRYMLRWLVVLMCGAIPICAFAQHTMLIPLFPTDESVNVDPDAAIVIRAPAPIVIPSVSMAYPDVGANGVQYNAPSVLLIPSSAAMLPQEGKIRNMVYGKYELADVRTLRFTHGRLLANTAYTCFVTGIVTTGGRLMPELKFSFTTRNVAPSVISCTFDSTTQLKCNQSFYVQLVGDAALIAANGARCFQLEKNETMDGSSWVPTPARLEFIPTRNVFAIHPIGSWPAGAAIRLHCTLGAVTGDQQADRHYTNVIRNAGRLKVVVSAASGVQVPEWVSEQFSSLDQTLAANIAADLSAPIQLGGGWRFVRWDNPLVADQNSPNTHVTFPCDLIAKENVVGAIVEKNNQRKAVIKTDTTGYVEVFNSQGQLIKTIANTTDTLEFNDSSGQVILVASPAAGFTFGQWNSTIAAFNGNGSAAIVATQAIQNQLGQNGANQNNANQTIPNINPRFYQGVASGETYKLKGYIEDVDADKLFDVNTGVHFTTAREFETGTQTTQTICVAADRCWEIVGYAIANTNRVDFFDGQRKLCLNVLLTNPENSVTFFAKRIPIYLRVEKVLLKSDDVDDVYRNKTLFPEAYVKVQKRMIDNTGRVAWGNLSQATCTSDGIAFSLYELACGDEIRFRVKGAQQRAQIWKFFANKPLYAIPDYVDTENDEYLYTMVIDTDIALFNATDCFNKPLDEPEIRVRACFKQKFAVESIGLTIRTFTNNDRSTSRFEERWYDPLLYRDLAADEPRGSRQIEYVPYHGTRLRVKFTLPIDVRSVHAGGMEVKSYSNMLVNDVHATGLDFNQVSSDEENINFESRDGDDLNTVVFDVYDPNSIPRKQALHGGLMDLFCYTDLSSLSGLPLETRALFILDRMQLPGYSLSLRSVEYAFDGDIDIWPFINNGDMYLAMYGGELAADQAMMTKSAFNRIPDCSEQQGTIPDECTIKHSDKDGPLDLGYHLLWMQPYWLDLQDIAWFYGSAYDEDCKDKDDCWVNRIQDVLNLVRSKADSYKSQDGEAPLDWSSIIPDLIGVGATFLGGLLSPEEQDDYLGQNTFIEGADTWWGMSRSSAPLFKLEHPNVQMTLEGRFYVDKAVIR